MQEQYNDILQKAIGELQNSNTIKIKGKDYTQVSTRLKIFRKYFATASIETLITHNDDTRVIIQTKISIDGNIVATGYAEEIRGDGNYINSTSAIENCETSSIGRALANMGLGGGSEYASANEVENAINQQQNQHYTPNNQNQQSIQNQHNQPPYQHQQDFSALQNVGLQVIQQGENLVVVGDGIFDKKSIIRNAGFYWNAENKQWYLPIRQAA